MVETRIPDIVIFHGIQIDTKTLFKALDERFKGIKNISPEFIKQIMMEELSKLGVTFCPNFKELANRFDEWLANRTSKEAKS